RIRQPRLCRRDLPGRHERSFVPRERAGDQVGRGIPGQADNPCIALRLIGEVEEGWQRGSAGGLTRADELGNLEDADGAARFGPGKRRVRGAEVDADDGRPMWVPGAWFRVLG